MLNEAFIKHIENICSKTENKTVKLRAYERIYGGDINEAFRLVMSEKDYFIKINEASYADMFQKEADGLQLLSDSHSFVIPKVYHNGIIENSAFLLLEFIPSLQQADNPKDFAGSLVKMHRATNDAYGLSYDNYIGRLPQKNTFNTDWIDFFIQNRLKFQIDLSGNKLPVKIQSQFEKLYQKLPDLLPVDKPSLLHGDLWSGNYFYNLQGKAVVFDPAVYYGHREVDLAMMSLFGGFSRDIYDIYNTLFPLETGWQDRLKIYQLYPLLVHFNLFGNSYLSGIQQVLDFYVKNK